MDKRMQDLKYIVAKLPFVSDRDLAFLARFIRALEIKGWMDCAEIVNALAAAGAKGDKA